jgi:hypothetical protein
MVVRNRFLLAAAFVGYAALVAYGVAVHEPWWDEAQAWLLARDAPLQELLTRDLAYEGHPPLWYLILKVPAALHLPYQSMSIVAALIGALGVILLLRLRRVPILARLALPFAFSCAYQYTVVARSYVLIPPLLWGILSLYEERDRKIIPFTLLLVGLGEVSLYGFALSAGLAGLFLIDVGRGRLRLANTPRWKGALSAALFSLNIIALAAILPIPHDLTSRSGIDVSVKPGRILQIAWGALAENLVMHADEPGGVAAAAVMAAVLAAWLWRRGKILEFVILFASLLPIASIYFSPWHEGVFFWAMVFVVLLTLSSRGGGRTALDRSAYVVLSITLITHCWWTWSSVRFDGGHQFTGSQEAARYLIEHRIAERGLFGAGIRCVELQPYFERNLFVNYHGGRRPAFWDWSGASGWPAGNGMAMRNWLTHQLGARPEHVLVAVSGDEGAAYGEVMGSRRDYRLERSFRGEMYWKDAVFRPMDFRLYGRVRRE